MKTVILGFLILLSSQSILAQNEGPLHPCRSQIQTYCAEEAQNKDIRGLVKCLIKNDHALSTECKQELDRFSKVNKQTTPPGGGPLGLLGGMGGLSAQVPVLNYQGSYIPGNNGSSRSTSYRDNSLKLSVPLLRKGNDTYSMSLNGSELDFGEKISLDSGIKIPKQLYKTELGLQYSHSMEGRKTFGFQGSYGYTGDKFTSETKSYSLNMNYSYPGSNEGHWVLMMFLSNNSPFGSGVPIPGFFYIYRTPKFTGVFGLPVLSMQWTPIDLWAFSFSALGPIIRTEVSYGTVDYLQVFSGFSWTQQRYILNERESNKDRLTMEEKKLEIGLRRPLFHKAFAELHFGQSFDRKVYIGKGLFDNEKGNANLNANWFLSWNVRFVF